MEVCRLGLLLYCTASYQIGNYYSSHNISSFDVIDSGEGGIEWQFTPK